MKRKIRVFVNLLMTCFLLMRMSYSMIGEERHKWHGIILLVLFAVHNILNRSFYKSLFRGRYSPYRIFQVLLAFLAVLSMTGAMVSGISMASAMFPYFPLRLRSSVARELHMISAYWGFVVLSLHLGLHWGMMIDRLKRKFPVLQLGGGIACLRAVGAVIAGYGIYAFIRREIGLYMTLQLVFVYYDFQEPLVLFLLDYLAVMGLYVWNGHYAAKMLKRIPTGIRKMSVEPKL